MSVRNRIYDAKALWEAERLEGAVIQVLIAFAATVRKRYPSPEKDSLATKAFVLEEMAKITNGPDEDVAFYHNGNAHVSLETLVYKVVRCKLVHEGQLPETIVFTHPIMRDGKLFNVLDLDEVTGFPIGWIWNLIRVMAEAPENKDEFPDGDFPLPPGYTVSAGLLLRYPDEHADRFPPNAPPLGQKYLQERLELHDLIEGRKDKQV